MTEEELLDFAELDDSLVSFSSFEDEDFAFSLLDEVTSAGSAGSPTLSVTLLLLEDFAKLLLDSSLALRMTDEELSFSEELLFSTLTGSSIALTESPPSPPHAARNNIKQEITILFLLIPISKLIKPSKQNSSTTNITHFGKEQRLTKDASEKELAPTA
jgi:hypothetical protein